jgi:radical SAM superfamily enzyme YgiQ (UPF0313 family)
MASPRGEPYVGFGSAACGLPGVILVKALLVYPEFPDTFWSFRHALPFVRRRAAFPPLGLLTVAALLPSDWQRRLIDLNVTPLEEADLAWADLVLVGAMAVQRASVDQILTRCRVAQVPVVAGGPLFTAEPERYAHVAHLVLDEAELTLPPFLHDFAQHRARHLYRAAGYASLPDSPCPEWELLDLEAYASMSVQYSRGCPYDCEFCNVTVLLGHRPRVKGAEQLVHELDALRGLGWQRGVFFVDDNLIGNRRHLKTALLPALLKWRKTHPEMVFNTEASINLADDPALMDALVSAGFSMVFVGIETPDAACLEECNKTHNLRRDMLADVQRMQRAGLQVQAGFIVGFDSDGPSAVRRVTEFIQRAGIATAMVGLLQALPGTRLHARMKTEGRLLPENSGDNAGGTSNIRPREGREGLQEEYRLAMRWLYAPRQYYPRVRRFLGEYAPHHRSALGGGRRIVPEVLAFARAAFRLGIVGEERLHYWWLLAWTLTHKPRALGLAVTLAIYGHHFRRTCDTHLAAP